VSVPSIARGVLIAALTLGLAGTLAAQRPGRGGGGAGGGMGASPLTRSEILEATLKLDKNQKRAVKTILDEGLKNATPIRDGLARTRGAIVAAIQAGKPQPEIDAAVRSYAEQAAAMTELEMKALAQVFQALDKEQMGNAAGVQSTFFMMRGIFNDKKWDDYPDSTKGY
jgi:Spy/CpxP family protein refolding chaperone